MVHRTPAFTSWYGQVFPAKKPAFMTIAGGFSGQIFEPSTRWTSPPASSTCTGCEGFNVSPLFSGAKVGSCNMENAEALYGEYEEQQTPKIYRLQYSPTEKMGKLSLPIGFPFHCWIFDGVHVKTPVILSAPNVIHLIRLSSPTKIKVPWKMEI